MSARLVPALALLVGACAKPPVEAPAEVADLSAFLFAHFEDEDPAELAAGLANLQDFLGGVDMSLDTEERALTLPILSGDDLGGLSIPAGIEASVQVPVALPGVSSFAPLDSTATVTEPNQVCIESSSTTWASRELLTDAACFEDASCDSLETLTEVRKENFIAKVWYDMFKNYRWVEFEDADGELQTALVGRAWIEEQFPGDGGSNSWDQLFQLDIAVPDGKGGSLRYFAMWSSVTLSGIGDDVYANLVRDGIADAYVYGDEFLAGNIETCTNDRDAEKPERE